MSQQWAWCWNYMLFGVAQYWKRKAISWSMHIKIKQKRKKQLVCYIYSAYVCKSAHTHAHTHTHTHTHTLLLLCINLGLSFPFKSFSCLLLAWRPFITQPQVRCLWSPSLVPTRNLQSPLFISEAPPPRHESCPGLQIRNASHKSAWFVCIIVRSSLRFPISVQNVPLPPRHLAPCHLHIELIIPFFQRHQHPVHTPISYR